ncbi:Rap guanine nucleotide exchange factor 2 [Halotydeus destructor]|nr:Rap guanine nucleotide exchange factor 2 [Halotydeus destructor]
MTSNCSSSEARFCSSLRTSQPATATAAAQYSSQRETSVDQDEDGDADEETDLTVHRQAGDDHDDVVDFVAAGHGRPSLLVTYDHHHQQRQQQLSSNGRGNSCCYWSDQEGEEDDEEEEEDEEEDEGAPVSSSVSSSSTSLRLGGGDSLLQLETPVDEEEGVVGVVVGGGEDTQAELQLIRRCLEVDPVERSVQQVALLHAYIDRHGFFWPQVSGPEARRRLARFLVLAVIESQQQQQQLILSEGELLDSLCVLIHGRVQVHESSATSSSTSQQHGRGFAFGFLGQERSGHSLYSARGPAGACCWFLCVSHFDLLSQVQPEQQQQHHHPYHPATQQSKTQQQQQEEDPKTPAKEGGEEQQQQRLLSGGELVLHLVAPERNNAGPRWQVARGSRRALLAHMLLTDDSGSDCVGADDSFRELMLLSFRAFPRGDSSAAEPKPLSELMGFLVDQAAASGELQAVVLRTVLLWLQNHYLDFEQEGAEGEGLLGQLRQGLEPRLAHSGQLVALLHLALSAKARPRTVQLTRSTRSEPLPFQLVGGYERGGAIFVSSSSSSTGSSSAPIGCRWATSCCR